ncbi:hypothetical protein N431DRAFT_441776 [Stipitochalara longipes BDJ]|nr:hypothetical protein N431DRAFT_441776 [Stipitochalara longipes BDJ]
MATQKQPPRRNFDFPFRGIAPEIRTMIWKHCISVALRIHETIEHGNFDSMINRSGRPRYIPLKYDFRYDALHITGIAIQNLGVILVDKKTSVEVVGMLREQMSLSFRALYFWDFPIVRKFREARTRVRSVTLKFERGDFGRKDEDLERLRAVMNDLDGFQAGMRLFVDLDEGVVELLMEGDQRLEPFAALLHSSALQGAVEHVRKGQEISVVLPRNGGYLDNLCGRMLKWEKNWTVECLRKEGSWAGNLVVKEQTEVRASTSASICRR